MQHWLVPAVVAVFALAPVPLRAQDPGARVSIEPPAALRRPIVLEAPAAPGEAAARERPIEIDRWGFGFDIGFNGQTGNTRVAILTTGAKITHLQRDVAEFEWTGNYRYGWSEGEVVARQFRSSLKLDLHPKARWSPFVYTQIEHNPILKLELRSNGGGGIKYTLAQGPKYHYSVSAAGLYNYEKFTDGHTPATASVTEPRMSWRLSAKQPVGPLLTLDHASLYQPVWDQADDYNVDATTSATARITQQIGLAVEHQYRHDSTPREGIVREDQTLTVGLKFNF